METERARNGSLGIYEVIDSEAAYLGRPAAQDQWALCLSGGGIRSATFCLGVLQGLARRHLLSHFQYISTVSGGGFIGSWLSRWIQEENGSVHKVEQTLATPVEPGSDKEPSQIRNLRAYSNYLSPVWGFSTDFFTLISIYFRNLLLNWLVLVPLLAATVLIPLIYLSVINNLSVLDQLPWVVPSLGALLVAIGIAFVVADLPEDRVEQSKIPNDFGRYCLLPIVLGAFSISIGSIAPLGGKSWFAENSWQWGCFAIAGAIIHFIGCLIGLGWRRVRQGTLAKRNTKDKPSRLKGTIADLLFVLLSGAAGGIATYVVTQLLRENKNILADNLMYAVWAPPSLLLCFWLATTIYVGPARYISSENEREWWARSGGWWLRISLLWILGCTLVLLGPHWINQLPAFQGLDSSTVAVGSGISGVIISLFGYWSKHGTKIVDKTRSFATKVGISILEIAAIVFIVGLLIAISYALAELSNTLSPKIESPTSTLITNQTHISSPTAKKSETKQSGKDAAKSHKDDTNGKVTSLTSLKDAAKSAELAARVAEASIKSSPEINVNTNALTQLKIASEQLYGLSTGIQASHSELNEAAELVAKTAELVSQSGNVIAKAVPSERTNIAASIKHAVAATTVLIAKREEAAKDISKQAERYKTLIMGIHSMPTVSLFIALLLLGTFTSLMVGVNTFSLHSLYGNRLVRAYFGAARDRSTRHPHWFTGFDFDDNVDMACLRFRNPPQLHIVNLALNLVTPSGDRLEWQQRKAASFTVSPLHAGGDDVGYTPSEMYAGAPYYGISLARAMTISGAAASSNMGYHSSPAVTFVMTLFNARLGWWLPNPSQAGLKAMARGEPMFSLYPILWEAFGLTTKDKDYVHVSDGGHFDNLGLYEMVRRRCTRIVVVDATCDPERGYEDLQDTLRKIRIDFGVSIDFPPHSFTAPYRCIVGTIRYHDIDSYYPNGTVYCLKPTLCNDEPLDVAHYAKLSKKRSPKSPFPHESTADQFFDEAQFESYRMLGLLTVEKTFGPADNWNWPAPPVPINSSTIPQKTGSSDEEVQKPAIVSPDAREGLLSSIGGTVQSMSQGALLASAVTVGGLVGVGGTIALQNPTVSLQPGTELAISKESLKELGQLSLKVEPPTINAKLDPGEISKPLIDLRISLEQMQKLWEKQPPSKEIEGLLAKIRELEDRLKKNDVGQGRTVTITDQKLIAAINEVRGAVEKLPRIPTDKPPSQIVQALSDSQLTALKESLTTIIEQLKAANITLNDVAPRRNVRGIEGGGK